MGDRGERPGATPVRSRRDYASRAGVELSPTAFVVRNPVDPTGETFWRLSQLSNAWRTVLGRASGRCRFHDLRHWHGSHLAGAGESPADGAAHLGHKQTSTFINMYAHPVDRSSASRIIGNLLERP